MLMQIPVANMGKRLAGPSQEPSSRPQKKAPDMASMGSLESEAGMETKEEEAQLGAAGQPPNLESAWGQYKPGQGSSQAMSSRLPGRSMMTGQEEGSLQNHMLTLLLQCSTRLRDLEAINFYTHVIPASSTLYKELEKRIKAISTQRPRPSNTAWGHRWFTGAKHSWTKCSWDKRP